MKKITLEQMEQILRLNDEEMPNSFSIKKIVYSKQKNAYFVKWKNQTLSDAYKNSVADNPNPKTAENAYMIDVKDQFSIVFINDNPDNKNKTSFVAHNLSNEEIAQYSNKLDNLILIDA